MFFSFRFSRFPLFLCIFFISALWGSEVDDLPACQVVAVTCDGFVGDKDAILAISQSLQRREPGLSSSHYEIRKTDEEQDIQSTIQKLSQSAKSIKIIISSGEYGVKLFSQLGRGTDRILVHAAHQLSAYHENLIGIADIIALPGHLDLGNFEAKLRAGGGALVCTRGVAHTASIDKYRQAYGEQGDVLSRIQSPILLWYLGGDAPDHRGQQHLYDEKSALSNLQGILKVRQKGQTIVVIDGPRTGMIDPVTMKPRNGSHETSVLNPITAFVRDQLLKEGLESAKDFYVFTFIKGQKSLLNGFLGKINQEGGVVVLPGESTSVITSCYDTLPARNVLVLKNSAMNEGHEAYLMFDKRIRLLNEEGIVTEGQKTVGAPDLSAAEKIAESILLNLKANIKK